MAYPTRLDSGPWFTVGEQLDGLSAYQRIRDARSRSVNSCRPYCVYVHVPFCHSICNFCALYTHGVGANAEDRFDEYIDVVLRSLPHNPWYGSDEAPTTVHFGGGTPLSLGVKRFTRLVRALTEAFGTSSACEWAVETTTSSLDGATVDALEGLQFRRIHLGIQTLDDTTRARIGRRESGATAIQRIVALEARGFLTSVDLILGLDGVDGAILTEDLRRLYEAGVRMFSICELRERSRKASVSGQGEREKSQRNYAFWRMIWDFMEEVGLSPIHVGQFACTQADNLYFTHPARGEDCVAIGPYAHGSAKEVAYGNHLLPHYYEAVRAGRSPIALGVDYRAAELAVCALERELLTHSVSQAVLRGVLEAYPNRFESILDSWLTNDLIREVDDGLGLALTVCGSWFVGNMILETRIMAELCQSNQRASF
ncbi:MAG TPA: radical SAM protein [Candidatus Angelobacter sp.]|nr:radical SAM protein [Candidatus Angelobacter sp.]